MENQKKKDLAKIALTAFMLSATLPAAGNATADTGIQGTVLAGGGCGGHGTNHSCAAASRPNSSHCGAATQPSNNCGAVPSGNSSIKPDTYKPYMPHQTNQPAGQPSSQPNKPVSRPAGQPSRSMKSMNEPFSANDSTESRWDSKTVAVESIDDQRGYGMKPQDQVPGKPASTPSSTPVTAPSPEKR